MAFGFQAGLDTGMNFVRRLKEWMAGSGVDLLTNLLVSAVILLVGWVVIRLVDKALRKAMARANRKVLLVNFIVSVVTKVGWAILLVTILSRLGVDVTPLIAGLGVTGFILGFAFQESLGNLASGLMIAINEPFKVGDVVDAAGHTGSVLEVNMMATVMLTPDNKRIVLPNKGVWGGPIVNYSAMDTRRVDLQVGIAYGEDVEKAVSVIRDAVRRVPGVLATPEPAVAVAGLDASQVTINVRPWAKNADYWSVRSATLQTVKEELDRVGIEIPFPQVVVHQSVKK